jgi:pimeloyl-ACP methyl ester carboxylesterase
MRARARAAAVAALVAGVALAGCVTPPQARCPSCRVIDRAHPELPELGAGVERLFVLVPGTLGYGWEWDTPVARLRAAHAVETVVFWWDPWGSLDRAARDLADLLARLQEGAPPSLREIVVVAHSGGGLVAAHALGHLAAPATRLTVVTIGAPFAGMHICPCAEEDVVHAPTMLSIATRYRRYPDPPPGVEVIEYVTSYPSDPVMHPYWGRSAAPPDIGPAGARRIPVDPRLDHNFVVDRVVSELLARHQ